MLTGHLPCPGFFRAALRAISFCEDCFRALSWGFPSWSPPLLPPPQAVGSPRDLGKSRKAEQPCSPVADRIGPRALARAPRLRRIPITLPFWPAEPVKAESRSAGCSFVLPGAGAAWRAGTAGAPGASSFGTSSFHAHCPSSIFFSPTTRKMWLRY